MPLFIPSSSGLKVYVATSDPGVSNDNTQGYTAGSFGVNTNTGRIFYCRSAGTGVAIWNGAALVDHPGFVSNAGTEWYPSHDGTLAAGGGLGASTQYFSPFYLTERFTVSSIGTNITTLAAAGNFQLGIYTDAVDASNTHRPANLIDKTVSTLSTAATGFISGALGANQQLEPGIYWASRGADNTTVHFITPAITTTNIAYRIGSTIGLSVTNTTCIVGVSRSQAFGTMPASVGGSTWTEINGIGVALGLLIASVP